MIVIAALVLAVASAACGSSDGGPSDEPPWGLDTIDLPDDAASIEAVMAEMPERVAGLAREYVTPEEVDYEEGTKVRAVAGTMTVVEYLETLSGSGEVEVEHEGLDPDAGLVYLAGNTTANGKPVWVASWGDPDSTIVFAATGSSPEARAAVIQAFVEATSAG